MISIDVRNWKPLWIQISLILRKGNMIIVVLFRLIIVSNQDQIILRPCQIVRVTALVQILKPLDTSILLVYQFVMPWAAHLLRRLTFYSHDSYKYDGLVTIKHNSSALFACALLLHILFFDNAGAYQLDIMHRGLKTVLVVLNK